MEYKHVRLKPEGEHSNHLSSKKLEDELHIIDIPT